MNGNLCASGEVYILLRTRYKNKDLASPPVGNCVSVSLVAVNIAPWHYLAAQRSPDGQVSCLGGGRLAPATYCTGTVGTIHMEPNLGKEGRRPGKILVKSSPPPFAGGEFGALPELWLALQHKKGKIPPSAPSLAWTWDTGDSRSSQSAFDIRRVNNNSDNAPGVLLRQDPLRPRHGHRQQGRQD